MKIAFVQDIIQFSVPLGTTLIAGNLRHAGHDVEIYVVPVNDAPALTIGDQAMNEDEIAAFDKRIKKNTITRS